MEKVSDFGRIDDPDLIGRNVKEEIEKLVETHDADMEEVVDQAFTRGIAHYAVRSEKIDQIDSDNLVDDSFSYTAWQMDLYPDIKKQNGDLHWSEVKTSFLKKGLEHMKGN